MGHDQFLGVSTYLSIGFCLPLVWQALGFLPRRRGAVAHGHDAGVRRRRGTGPWLGNRAAVAALAVPAGALYAHRELSGFPGSTAVISLAELLIVMAALVALSGGPVRLPRSWLWLPCALPLVLAAGRLLHPPPSPVRAVSLELDALVLLAVVVVGWLVTDARPAFALCLAVLLWAVMTALVELTYGPSQGMLVRQLWLLEYLLIRSSFVVPVLLPAAWLLLRRPKTPGSHPFPEP